MTQEQLVLIYAEVIQYILTLVGYYRPQQLTLADAGPVDIQLPVPGDEQAKTADVLQAVEAIAAQPPVVQALLQIEDLVYVLWLQGIRWNKSQLDKRHKFTTEVGEPEFVRMLVELTPQVLTNPLIFRDSKKPEFWIPRAA